MDYTEYTRRLFNDSQIHSYEGVKKYFATCRNPEKGKPLKSWARIFKRDDDYIICCDGVDVLKITPDNKLTFLIDGVQGRTIGQTLASSLHRAVPIAWSRVSTNRYRVIHLLAAEKTGKSLWQSLKTAPELFEGITFDLTTGECVNARKDLKESIRPEIRKEWLRKLRVFKRNIKLRAKMGVIDGLIKQMREERDNSGNGFRRPDWNSPPWFDLLYNSISNEECSTELLRGLIASSGYAAWYMSMPTSNHVVGLSDTLLNQLSIALREKFGVFDIQPRGKAA